MISLFCYHNRNYSFKDTFPASESISNVRVVVSMEKDYIIYEGYIHEVDWDDWEQEPPKEETKEEEATSPEELASEEGTTDSIKLDYDRMERWLRKKAELFR